MGSRGRRDRGTSARTPVRADDPFTPSVRFPAVRNLVRSGVSDNSAMKATGHKTRSVFDRYDIVSTSDLRDASRKFHAYLRESRTGS